MLGFHGCVRQCRCPTQPRSASPEMLWRGWRGFCSLGVSWRGERCWPLSMPLGCGMLCVVSGGTVLARWRLSLPCDACEPLIVLCFGRVRAGRMQDGRGAGCTDGADIVNGRDTGGFHSTWHAVVCRHKVAADPVKCQHDTPNSFVHCSSAVEISSTGVFAEPVTGHNFSSVCRLRKARHRVFHASAPATVNLPSLVW